jgi:hypothetical protein
MSFAPNPLDALLDAAVERAIMRLLPHIANPRAVWTTPKNAAETFGGKTWRAVDEWAQRRGLRRYQIAGSPAYKTVDLDVAVEVGTQIEEEEDEVIKAARKRAARVAR